MKRLTSRECFKHAGTRLVILIGVIVGIGTIVMRGP
jgi:hypothetical protein